MLQEFATWYGHQMAALLPTLVARDRTAPAGLLVSLETARGEVPAVRLAFRRGGRESVSQRFLMDGPGLAAARAAIPGRGKARSFLRLPHGMLLERTVSLPLAAEPSLDRVIGFELDRYTPFAAEEVYWAARVLSRDRVQGRIQVTITLVPRTGLAPALAALRQIGISPVALEGYVAAAGPGRDRRIPLASEAAARAARRGRALAWAGAVGCLLLAAAAAGLPFIRQSQERAAIEAQIAVLQPRMNQADAIRQTLAARGAGSNAIAAEQAQVADPLQTIAALTQILPDDTFLTTLVVQKRAVTIEGQSANAARLIGSLSNDPVIHNAAFAAPVTRNEAGADLFSIKAEVRP